MANLIRRTPSTPSDIIRPQIGTSVAPVVSQEEAGVTGGLSFRNFIDGETISALPVSYKKLQELTQQDGQARAILQLVTNPIQVADWDVFTPDEDDVRASGKKVQAALRNPNSAGSAERDFIENNLFGSVADGGMSIPFKKIIATMVLAVRDGFKTFEKVWKINNRGQIVLKKLAVRNNDTLNLLADFTGDFNGVHQRTVFEGRTIDVIIPREKCLHFVYGGEENQLYGSPVFLPIYYHYDKKHKLYYITHIAYQNLAVPGRVGTVGANATPETRDEFLRLLKSVGFNFALTIPDGWKVEPFESNRAIPDFITMIDHHDNQMSKSVLAHFIDLQRSGTGQLTQEQSDLFVLGLEAIIGHIEDAFNYWLIPQLIDFNFKSGVYPKLRARPFTDTQQKVLKETYEKVIAAGTQKTSSEFIVELEKQMAAMLNIDNLDYDQVGPKLIKQIDDAAKAASSQGLNGANGPGARVNPSGGGSPESNNVSKGAQGNEGNQ